MAEDTTTISIPQKLAEKIKERCQGTEFDSVSSYVTYILEQVLSNMEQETTEKDKDEELVKERLKGLGYLD